MTSTGDPPGSTCKSIVTQMYTFSSWSKQKNGQSSSSMLSYVGFPGLSLTPIPENPLLDGQALNEDADPGERDRWLLEDSKKPLKNGSLPRHWGKTGGHPPMSIEENGEVETIGGGSGGGKDCTGRASRKTSSPPSTCSVNVHVVQTTTFLPKDEPMTREEKRAHLCKLLLFALCGFVIVAGIVLWIFSPAFT